MNNVFKYCYGWLKLDELNLRCIDNTTTKSTRTNNVQNSILTSILINIDRNKTVTEQNINL